MSATSASLPERPREGLRWDRAGVRKICGLVACETVARLITVVATGKVNPRVAAGLVRLLGLQLRAIEVADLDVRVKKLEQASNR
jgi:hypothetical protein